MVRVTIEIDIQYPAQKTFNFIANPENNPIWQNGMDKCVITKGPLGIGAEYRQEAHFLGKTISSTFAITEFTEGKSIKGETIESTFPITFIRTVDGNDQISKVKAIVTGQPKGLLGKLPFITRWMINQSIQKDYKRLKQILEKK